MYNFKFRGFTLAEVLITLGIIGVVAAITIPSLMTNYKANKLKTQFRKSYSTLAQAYRTMIADEESVINSDYEKATFYKEFSKHLKVLQDCGNYYAKRNNNPPCYAPNGSYNKYKNLNGTIIGNPGERLLDDGTLLLLDGTLVYFENNQENDRIYISVDLNGIEGKPNILGYDLFMFQLIDGELKPMGMVNTNYPQETYCNLNSNSQLNGIGCTELAIHDEDYFKKIVKKIK